MSENRVMRESERGRIFLKGITMYLRHATIDTRVGQVTIVASDDTIVGIYYPHHWTRPSASIFGVAGDSSNDTVLTAAREQLAEYLDGARTSFDLPVVTHGNPFQERVWALLNQIPYGETTTYGELAEKLGGKSLARMVGQAVGHNPLSVIVPCHRVVGKDGKLTGYAGGLERKKMLLSLEGSMPATSVTLF